MHPRGGGDGGTGVWGGCRIFHDQRHDGRDPYDAHVGACARGYGVRAAQRAPLDRRRADPRRCAPGLHAAGDRRAARHRDGRFPCRGAARSDGASGGTRRAFRLPDVLRRCKRATRDRGLPAHAGDTRARRRGARGAFCILRRAAAVRDAGGRGSLRGEYAQDARLADADLHVARARGARPRRTPPRGIGTAPVDQSERDPARFARCGASANGRGGTHAARYSDMLRRGAARAHQ